MIPSELYFGATNITFLEIFQVISVKICCQGEYLVLLLSALCRQCGCRKVPGFSQLPCISECIYMGKLLAVGCVEQEGSSLFQIPNHYVSIHLEKS